MPDMLVKLYNLNNAELSIKSKNIIIRRLNPSEANIAEKWVNSNFPQWYGSLIAGSFQTPSKCYIAVEVVNDHIKEKNTYHTTQESIVGFACYDVAAKGMFGPLAVQEDYQDNGIGKALLLKTLQAMHDEGYAYAIIGWVSSEEFYQKCAGAVTIESSEPGIFSSRLI